MRKLILLSFLLLCTISLAQQITKKQAREEVNVAPQLVDEIISTRLINIDYDAVLSASGDSNLSIISDENTVYNTAGIEVKPEFPGGNEKMNLFISKNLTYSKEMIEDEVKSKVFASFIVEKNGTLSDIKIIRDCGYNTAKMIMELLKKMPLWNPGIQNGKTVRCSFILPILIDAAKQ